MDYRDKYAAYLPPQSGNRFANEREIRKNYTYLDLEKKQLETSGIPIISNGSTAYVDGSEAHTGIFGSSGSGKTRCFIMPLLKQMVRAGESFVVMDPKGELAKTMQPDCRSYGYQIRDINLRDFSGHGYNPLAYPYELYCKGEEDKAVQGLNDLVHALAKSQESKSDPFWTFAASMELLGIFLVLFTFADKEEINIASALHLSHEECYRVLRDITREYFPANTIAGANLRSVLGAPERTRQSIQVSLGAMLQPFSSNQALVNMLSDSSGNAINLSDLGRKKTAIFINTADESTTYHFLATIFVQQLYQRLIEEAQTKRSGCLPIRFNFVLDEFGNMPQINNFSSAISAARSRNIRYYLVIQSKHQLNDKYGDNDAQTIIANLLNIVFLNSRELPLLQEIESLCGKDFNGVPLISVSQLQRLRKENKKYETLFLLGRHYPFVSTLPDISMYPGFKNSTEEEYEPIRIKHRRAQIFDILNPMVVLERKEKEVEKADAIQYNKKNINEEDDFEISDVQCELEKKFDELFGPLDDEE